MPKRATDRKAEETIIMLYVEKNWSIRDIGDYMCLGYGTIHRRLRDHNVEMRKQGFKPVKRL